ncbi:CGNR zinc finger domain-containing protein [Streptomyces anulatus]|uniref:CGNR zinc finger domain-containing protein n=1 Tax=Streptomyces TaxID=1883 RepID=UPI000BFE7AD4|nr:MULTISPECIES: CGNR zinc finger domain-containing protein [unclassified Streptomyces]MBT1100235.1 ABATE domain-containing protein [Streptomyces sp. Tu10]WTC61501.1 CGNR zinc finger domain-containing protein [Streptomyces anulatus]WTC75504.1 CGNR zinc finger domain-containing protein [Streptomyces anulatus]WUD87116.1 CGNR zinc finger domain-containing protein [Streptomyces anulatus]
MERWLALELVSTIRHDGDGGVADDLATVQGTTHWIQEQGDLLAGHIPAGELAADENLRRAIIELRQAVRALFARAVSPTPPSPPDAHRLITADQAVAHLNTAAEQELVAPQMDWPVEGAPTTRLLSAESDPYVRLVAALARAAIDFLSGPQRTQLRSCTAPRCVRYFVKSHGRQEWCKPSCGNRARAARHYRRQRTATDGGSAPS